MRYVTRTVILVRLRRIALLVLLAAPLLAAVRTAHAQRHDHPQWSTETSPGSADRQPVGRRRLSGSFDTAEALDSGGWGCPSPVRIHPLDKVPTIVFWKQSSYGQTDDPQCDMETPLVEGLRFAVYVGWPDPRRPDDPDTLWRYYNIPNPTGDPCADRLERPRIQFKYDNDGYPAIVIGRDNGGIRYQYEVPGAGLSPVFIGDIELIRPGLETGQAGVWNSDLVRFGLPSDPVAGRLDYPDLTFDPDGRPLVSAIGYDAMKDDYDADHPYEELMLARRGNNGVWRSQRVLKLVCPGPCGSPGSILDGPQDSTDDDTDTPEFPAGGVEDATRSGQLSQQSLNHCIGGSFCPTDKQYLPAHPALTLGPPQGQTPTVRLVFSFGHQRNAAADFQNFVYALDLKASAAAMNGYTPLVPARKELIKSHSTSDLWNDDVHIGCNSAGSRVASYVRMYSDVQGMDVDWFESHYRIGANWFQDESTLIESLYVDYDRTHLRWWSSAIVAEMPTGAGFGLLAPKVINLQPFGLFIDESGQSDYGVSLSYLDGSDATCGLDHSQACPTTVVDALSGDQAFEASIAFGAFDLPGLSTQWVDRPIIAYHGDVAPQSAGIILTSTESAGTTAFPTASSYGDFNFDQTVNDQDYWMLVQAREECEGGRWTRHPVCDYNSDGTVDGDDEAAFEAAYCADCSDCEPDCSECDDSNYLCAVHD